MRASVNLTAFNTVIDHLAALGLKLMLIPPIVVKPQPEEQHKATRQIEEKKQIHIESNHSCNVRELSRGSRKLIGTARDSGFGIRDSGFGIREARGGNRSD
jgi:hypothetical protein